MEAAADQRYWDSVELALSGRRYGAIYMLGYTAEIYLKLAALRSDGLRPASKPSAHTSVRHRNG
jgi:hypothetical protein